jgi:probable F420-dependent oxidoreductase
VRIGAFVFQTEHCVDTAIVAKRLEEVGFDSFWVPEHPLIPVNSVTPFPGAADGIIPDHYLHLLDPFVALARASAVTERIELGTGICLVPERNPLLLAKEVATLDFVSGGRFVFGIGAGWLKEETELLGGDFEHRWTQTRDAIMAMKKLWTEDEAEYRGEYYDFPAVWSYPKPARKPHPPVYLGGGAKNVLKRVVDYGDGWMPIRTPWVGPGDVEGERRYINELKAGRATLDELAESAGRDPATIEILAFGLAGQFRDRESIDNLVEAGVDRATVWLMKAEQGEEAVLAEIEELAERVL